MLTAKQQKVLQAYVREVATHLGLKDWEIAVGRDFAGEGRCAENQLQVTAKACEIRVSDEFMGLPPIEQVHTVLHELLHCHFRQYHDLFHYTFPETSLSKPELKIIMSELQCAEEVCVDGLAQSLKVNFNPIQWGDTVKR